MENETLFQRKRYEIRHSKCFTRDLPGHSVVDAYLSGDMLSVLIYFFYKQTTNESLYNF